MRSVPVLAALALLLAPAALAAQAPARESRSPQRAVVVTPGSEVWGPAPAILPAGAQLAVLEGDPTKAGSYSMRLRMPDGYRIPPHFHPSDEHVTVVSGTFQVGMGDRFDAAALKPLPPGRSRCSHRACGTSPGPRAKPSSNCMVSGRGA
jgi:hypothetical protein